jgi:sugar lactone lactonase YvrE
MKILPGLLACALTLLVTPLSGQTYSWTVFAGTPPAPGTTGSAANAGSTDGTGMAARFNQPHYLAIDSTNTLFLADTGNATIRRISSGSVVSTYLGVAGTSIYVDGAASLARFEAPMGITAAPNSALLVTEVNSHTVRLVTASREVATAAGFRGFSGSVDATLEDARFFQPSGVVLDSSFNAYVADSANHTIRRVSLTSVVTTFAGTAGQTGTLDGAGTAARFNSPRGLAIDRENNLYVADSGNHTIRKITPSGIVTTVAGLGGFSGSNDGSGTGARFTTPWGVATDAAGNVYVADTGNHMVRKISPAGIVSTIGGAAGVASHAEGNRATARFSSPVGIAVDAAGAVFVAVRGNHLIARGALDTQPAIAIQPQSQTVSANTPTTFSVIASGGGLSYQWRFNGTPIPGATSALYAIASTPPTAAGSYTVEITNSVGSVTSTAATLTVNPEGTPLNPGRIVNLAIRSQAGTAAQTLIVGFAVGGGSTNKPVLLRGVGPTLAAFNVNGALVDPRLELYAGSTKLNENDDWGVSAQISAIATQVGAFAYASAASKDSALYNPGFAPGSYSVWITGNGGSTGIALAEIYDATPASSITSATPRLTNVSARTQVGSGDDLLIAGFVIGGSSNRTVLIRAVGPTLSVFGVPGVLANPKLELFSGSTRIYENDDWGGAAIYSQAFTATGAFALPTDSRDAVLLVNLAPGNYTAQVSGVGGTTGVGLVEVYEVP